MPTSNGLVTARDIRQNAVKNIHIAADAVDTDQMVDLATTIAKTAAPVAWTADEEKFHNISLTTTWQRVAEIDLTVPAWASQAAVVAAGVVQVSNGATAKHLNIAVRVNEPDAEEPPGAYTNRLPASATTQTEVAGVVATSVTPGGTLNVACWARVTAGTETSNLGIVDAMAAWAR